MRPLPSGLNPEDPLQHPNHVPVQQGLRPVACPKEHLWCYIGSHPRELLKPLPLARHPPPEALHQNPGELYELPRPLVLYAQRPYDALNLVLARRQQVLGARPPLQELLVDSGDLGGGGLPQQERGDKDCPPVPSPPPRQGFVPVGLISLHSSPPELLNFGPVEEHSAHAPSPAPSLRCLCKAPI